MFSAFYSELSERERLAIAVLLACVLVLTPVALWRHGLLGARASPTDGSATCATGAAASADTGDAGPAAMASASASATASAAAPGGPGGGAAEPESPRVVVHVVGAVRCPGVYELDADARVVDAVRAAGGESEQAATWSINMAARVSDGDRVYVPTREEVKKAAGSGWSGARSADWNGQNGPSPGLGLGAAGTGPLQVDINRASVAELDRVPGIGPTLAQRIVSHRQAHGPFARVEDLVQVPGIGPRTLERMKDWLVAR